MKRKLFNTTKKHGPKVVVFLLLTVLALTFLPADQGGYAAFGNVYDAGVEGTSDVPDTRVLAEADKLPQTSGISPSTLIGLMGLAMITTGGTIFTILKKKSHDKNS